MGKNDITDFFDSPAIRSQFAATEQTSESDIFTSNADLPFHLLRRNRIRNTVTSSLPPGSHVLEIGCGVGILGLEISLAGYDYRGIDIASEMIRDAKNRFELASQDPSRLSVGDVFDLAESKLGYDLIVSDGVICYYQDQANFLLSVEQQLRAGGRAVISHRNALFNLFALNDGTLEFVAEMTEEATGLPAMTNQSPWPDTFPIGIRRLETPSNATLYRSQENPLAISGLYEPAGLAVEHMEYTYLHPAPPGCKFALSAADYERFDSESSNSWRGMFMGSQFIVSAKKMANK